MVRLAALLALVALGCNAGPLQFSDAALWSARRATTRCTELDGLLCSQLAGMALETRTTGGVSPSVYLGGCAPRIVGGDVEVTRCSVNTARGGAYTGTAVVSGSRIDASSLSINVTTTYAVDATHYSEEAGMILRSRGTFETMTIFEPAE